ncbi:hypothetical protein KR018_008881 [Drosophila ironensis]|nr:hypothetical protein KR018_008881 [Drosophila ironensis]
MAAYLPNSPRPSSNVHAAEEPPQEMLEEIWDSDDSSIFSNDRTPVQTNDVENIQWHFKYKDLKYEDEGSNFYELAEQVYRKIRLSHMLFFGFVALLGLFWGAYVLYVNHLYLNPVGQMQIKYVLCKKGYWNPRCISEIHLDFVVDMAREIYDILWEKSVARQCNNVPITPILLSSEYKQTSMFSKESDFVFAFASTKYLIERNPSWHIKSINDGIYFELDGFKLPLMCAIATNLNRIFVPILTFLLMAFLIYLYIDRHMMKIDRRREIKERTAEWCCHIFHELINSPDDYILIVRERFGQMIPWKKRDEYKVYWHEALKILKEDTRVQIYIADDRDLTSAAITWKSMSSKTVWQRPAMRQNGESFPTSFCIMVTNLVDISEQFMYVNARRYIKNLICERVHDQCEIADIQFEWQYNRVLIRFASNLQAALVTSHLDGWWYRRRYITTRYISPRRFLHCYAVIDSMTD